jgi:hypothetical protein
MYSGDQHILKEVVTVGFIRKVAISIPHDWDDNTEKDDQTSHCVRGSWGSRLCT